MKELKPCPFCGGGRILNSIPAKGWKNVQILRNAAHNITLLYATRIKAVAVQAVDIIQR